jgi:hypothetical protein
VIWRVATARRSSGTPAPEDRPLCLSGLRSLRLPLRSYLAETSDITVPLPTVRTCRNPAHCGYGDGVVRMSRRSCPASNGHNPKRLSTKTTPTVSRDCRYIQASHSQPDLQFLRLGQDNWVVCRLILGRKSMSVWRGEIESHLSRTS